MLANKIAWITGGARGIGEATARIMAREGARVVVSDLDTDACGAVVKVRQSFKIKTLFSKIQTPSRISVTVATT